MRGTARIGVRSKQPTPAFFKKTASRPQPMPAKGGSIFIGFGELAY
jgi:hypothetical protein